MKKERNAQKPKRAKPARNGKARKMPVPRRGVPPQVALSKAGTDFLKCAFAAPDFNDDQGAGLPLGGDHRVLLKKHRFEATEPLTGAATTGTSYYFLQMATPGQAFWVIDSPTNTPLTYASSWNVKSFGDCFGANALFTADAGTRSANVSAFRYTSMSCEFKDLTSQYLATGGLKVQKLSVKQSMINTQYPMFQPNILDMVNPLKVSGTGFTDSSPTPKAVVVNQTNVPITQLGLSGLEATGVAFSRCYTEHVHKGAFSVATRTRDANEFRPIIEGYQSMNNASSYAVLNAPYLGIDDSMNAIFARIDVPAGVTLSVQLRAWACVEYIVGNSSPLYEYSRLAPPRDELAIQLYHKYAEQLEIAVPAAQNDFSWAKLWNWVKAALSTAAAVVPGPVGLAASAAGALATAIEQMVV